LAARLAHAGQAVCAIARGAHGAAIAAHGLQLKMEDGEEITARMPVFTTMGEAGKPDVIVLGMKAHQLSSVARDVAAAYHESTIVLSAQNGIPWWYFQSHGGTHDGRALASVDPGGVIAQHIAPSRIIGSVVYPAAEISAPGVIRHIEGLRFSLSELNGEKTARAEELSQRLTAAGFKAPLVSDIRAEIWTKLWGNLSFNPISALTHATLAQICADEDARTLAAQMMREAQEVGEKLGIRFRISLEKRIAGAAAVGEHKTSMLQDVEAGRAIELDALVGSIIELGEITGVATPAIRAVYACTKLLAHTLAREGGAVRIMPV
ncbi:MAG: 2-dehydropantoate 2-reductase, partial [Alphaproteobacteria bacterium]|nr:2-dehydropantoate 2-reductase [Alphaproteobacteria bacterium]